MAEAGKILDLLDHERRAILEARFDVLERLEADKERLLTALMRANAGEADLRRIGAAAMRNASLLRAMGDGIRRAQAALAAARAPAPLVTYGRDGVRHECGGALPRLAHKA